MEIVKCKYRLKCELGACGKRAEYSVMPARTGVRSSLNVCRDCLTDLVMLGYEIVEGAGYEA